MDKPKTLTIEHRSYFCHPETCSHKNHYSFLVLEDGNYVRGFDTESEAKSFVEKKVEAIELEEEWLEMNQQHEQAVKECFEVNAENRKLQKRVDAVKGLIEDLNKCYQQDHQNKFEYWRGFADSAGILGKRLEQALNGDQYDEHRKKAEEAISKGASLTNHRIEL